MLETPMSAGPECVKLVQSSCLLNVSDNMHFISVQCSALNADHVVLCSAVSTWVSLCVLTIASLCIFPNE